MKWFHRVDPEWLDERKNYLTASDVKRLIPVTATGKPRANMDEAYIKVWAEKQCLATEDDICSQGAAARGHLLEPYAIEEFNKLKIAVPLNHWDDTLIFSKDGVSHSPDSLDLMPCRGHSISGEKVPATFLGEVKAYQGDKHYLIGLADRMTIEERWQIATAFYTIPTLVAAVLILFNPSAKHPLFYHKYTRADLHDELDMIEQVNEQYNVTIAKLSLDADAVCPPSVRATCIWEDKIVKQLEQEAEVSAGLNP